MPTLHRPLRTARSRQRGAALILATLALVVLLGLAGVAIDGGRLFVNKTELQTAADACALAAAAELTCNPASVPGGNCPTSYQTAATAAGRFAAQRNRSNLQSGAVAVAAADVRFSTALGPNGNYAAAGAANPNSNFAMCIARASSTGGVLPTVMSALGAGTAEVTAMAVATLAPAAASCPGAPIGLCSAGAGGNFGYAPGQWIASNFTGNGANASLSGGFKWVDFTPGGGGANEVRDQLAGTAPLSCGVSTGSSVAQPGTLNGVKHAYNTRFGLYSNGSGYTFTTAPPDRTGFAYPSSAPAIPNGTSAYRDYLARQQTYTPYTPGAYAVQGPGGNMPPGTTASAQNLRQYGSPQRRLIAVPVIACGAGNTAVIGMACVLMLNPMSNGNTGTVYLEYRGNAATPGSGCAAMGAPGGGGVGTGALVPTLVQ